MAAFVETLRARMAALAQDPHTAAQAMGLHPRQVEGYVAGRFPTAAGGGLQAVANYLGLDTQALLALKPGRAAKSKAVRSATGQRGRGRAKAGATAPSSAPALASLTVFGTTVTFASIDELSAYLSGERGEISIQVLGRKLVFNSLGEVQGWMDALNALFAQR